MTKILIIGDQHGQIPNVHFKDFDFIMCPGDFCSDKLRVHMFKAYKWNLKYPKNIKYWWEIIGKFKAKKEVQKSVKDGRKLLEFLNKLGKPVYVLPGNWDWADKGHYPWKYLQTNFYKQNIKGLKNIKDCHMKIHKMGDYSVVGYGICSAPEYPQDEKTKSRYDKKELLKKKKEYLKTKKNVDVLFKKAKKPIIFFSHNVPFNTKLDKITNKESPMYGKHFGSVIARELIEKYQPVFCEAGHMHEHYAKDKIGRTVCINSGFGKNANVLVELEGNQVLSVKFNK